MCGCVFALCLFNRIQLTRERKKMNSFKDFLKRDFNRDSLCRTNISTFFLLLFALRARLHFFAVFYMLWNLFMFVNHCQHWWKWIEVKRQICISISTIQTILHFDSTEWHFWINWFRLVGLVMSWYTHNNAHTLCATLGMYMWFVWREEKKWQEMILL